MSDTVVANRIHHDQNETPLKEELLDQLLANYQKPDDLIGAEGILKQLTKKLLERALDAELTHHLGYDKHQRGERC